MSSAQTSADDPDRPILFLSALCFLLYPPPFIFAEIVARVVAGLLLIFPTLLRRSAPWLILLATNATVAVVHWSDLDNHQYLLTYWMGVCLIASTSARPAQVLAFNGRVLIGLVFFFATAGKLLGGAYLNGAFFQETLLTDARLETFARIVGGVDQETLAAQKQMAREALLSGRPVVLEVSPRFAWICLLVSWWTLAIEGALAWAYLSNWPRWLARYRDVLLVIFVATTYLFTPVPGFGAVLLLMCCAETPLERRSWRTFLAVLILCLPLIVDLGPMIQQPFEFFLMPKQAPAG